jgi:hypothetical protein
MSRSYTFWRIGFFYFADVALVLLCHKTIFPCHSESYEESLWLQTTPKIPRKTLLDLKERGQALHDTRLALS